MSGHSKWHSIRRQKGAADAKRGQLFSKLVRAIIVAAREGGPDPAANLALANAIEKARENSMPKDNIERAIARGSGTGADAAAYERVTYEGYGPGGVAVMVRVLTDNKNRTAPEIRHAFAKLGGNLGEVGSVGWMFERKGIIQVETARVDEDELFGLALDAGAADLKRVDPYFEITAAPQDLEGVRRALEARGVPIQSAEVTYVPQSTVRLEGKDAQQVLRLVEGLEELDDVQHVYANFDIPDEVLEAQGVA
jgi:YebC/PmpR family DNA-binding regulatory protein